MRLEAIRRYLVEVRDGRLPATLAFARAGDRVAVDLSNVRAAQDGPVRIAALAASGPFRLEPTGTCRTGQSLAGQGRCTIVLRHVPAGSRDAASDGQLTVRFAPTPGLVPQARHTALLGPR